MHESIKKYKNKLLIATDLNIFNFDNGLDNFTLVLL